MKMKDKIFVVLFPMHVLEYNFLLMVPVYIVNNW